jgi:hypothetical protein
MNRSFLALSFLLIACGTEGPSVQQADELEVGASNGGLRVTAPALQESRKAELENAYKNIDSRKFAPGFAVPEFAEDSLVVTHDVTGAIPEIRLDHVREVWVIAGTISAPKDPNKEEQFYVVFHKSDATTIYGPFAVRGNAGDACGSDFTGALPSCNEPLTCVTADGPDQPGVCMAG